MTNYTAEVKSLIDDLKAICVSWGMSWSAHEYEIITQSFLYKFLNDKFLYEVTKRWYWETYDDLKKLSEDDYNKMLSFEIWNAAAHFKPEHLLSYLFNHQSDKDFSLLFDDTLNDIAVLNNDLFSVHTDDFTDVRLFSEHLIWDAVTWWQSKKDWVASSIINRLAKFKLDFNTIFSSGFDFFSDIFEYMISDYNKDSGKYAEYYTPHSVAKIIAEILVWDDNVSNVNICDPAAWSWTLLMNLASVIWTDNCTVYSQDISQKSSNLLRLNLILNWLTHSINNITQWNTILSDAHAWVDMDYIVSNPPFKLDFSERRDQAEALPNANTRFFAWVPTIPWKKKESMAIYLLFIQHIMNALWDKWKAAIVVPTWFITAQSWIEKKIREKITNNKWLKWVVSMPSNIFANTWTNVSVIFIDKEWKDDKALLVDASNLWEKLKLDWKNQKTVLSPEEEQKIIDTFRNKEEIEDFSKLVSFDDIKEKNCSRSAWQYFDVKIEYIDITQEEYEEMIDNFNKDFDTYVEETKHFQADIKDALKDLKIN